MPGNLHLPWRLASVGTPTPAPDNLTPEQRAEWDRIMEANNAPRRNNDGSWIIVDAEGQLVAAVAFRGKAKRGQGYNAPDPDGEAIARHIVATINAPVPITEGGTP